MSRARTVVPFNGPVGREREIARERERARERESRILREAFGIFVLPPGAVVPHVYYRSMEYAEK